MGQYHYVANYDKKEYLHPHKFNDGLKLMEFGCSAEGTLLGLTVLLAASNTPGARGGGDLHPWIKGHGAHDNDRTITGDPVRADWLMENVVGRWAGDRIAIIGDYNEPEDAKGLVGREGSPYGSDEERKGWKDISDLAIEAMELDYYVASSERAKQRRKWNKERSA